MDIVVIGLVIFLFLLAVAFCAASETGLTVADKATLHKLAGEGNKRAKTAIELRENKDSLIGTLLLFTCAVTTGVSIIGADVFEEIFGNDKLGIAITTAIMTGLILLFGEVIPKIYAYSYSVRIALIVAPVWKLLVYLFKPLTKLIEICALVLLRIFGYKGKAELQDGIEEIRSAIAMHHEEGGVVKDDRDMLGSILDLSQIEVGDIMVHRRDITGLNIDDAPGIFINAAIDSEHTRLPVWQGDAENIIGILNTKDVLRIDRHDATREQIKTLIKEPMFIPDSTTLKDQLENFRAKRNHIALVVDEYGSLMGLVTLEDILEEIVGQIDDEHDKVVRGIKLQKDGSYIVRGNLSIRDLNREMDWNLESDEDANTIAGYVIRLAENIPELGNKFRSDEFEFTVIGKIRNQITSVRITPLIEDSDEQE